MISHACWLLGYFIHYIGWRWWSSSQQCGNASAGQRLHSTTAFLVVFEIIGLKIEAYTVAYKIQHFIFHSMP